MLLENFVKKQEFKIYDKFNLWKCKNTENYYFNFKIEEGNVNHENFRNKISNYIKENISNKKNKILFEDYLCFPLDRDIKLFTESTDIDGIKKREKISLDKLKEILLPGMKIKLDLGIDFEDNLKITQLILKKINDIFMSLDFDSDRKYIEASISIKINNQEEEEIKISNAKFIDKNYEYKFEIAELVETNINGFIYPESYN